ncbi:unnamed protein product [Malus baccata var. baccata]
MEQPDRELMSSSFHIAMFPWFALGHMTPFLHLSNELAARGHKITFLLPKKAQILLQHLNLHPHLITFHPVTVPHIEGLPDKTEFVSEIPLSLSHFLTLAIDRTRDQIQDFLKTSVANCKVDMIFFDSAHWIPEIARGLGIKSIFYGVICAAAYALSLVPIFNYVTKDACMAPMTMTEEQQHKPPPGYPSSTVVLTRSHEVRSLMTSRSCGVGIRVNQRLITGFRAIKECDAFCLRTCREFEGDFCDYLEAQFQKPVLLTGPVLSLEKGPTLLEDRWADWFAAFEAGTVVFCAFGSQWAFEKDQFQELVLGFELTGLPFLVAVKPPLGCVTIEEALPEGFEERVRGRGVVFGGWVQQPLILSHPAVGCFVHHCGYGTMWESLMSENQIVLVPQLVDQILGAKLLAKELKVAVEVEREEDGWFSRESLSKAVKSVMDKGSDVGVMVKKNHAKCREIISEPGFMSGYVDRFVDNLKEHV